LRARPKSPQLRRGVVASGVETPGFRTTAGPAPHELGRAFDAAPGLRFHTLMEHLFKPFICDSHRD
jgi:hypothetical protein